MFVHVLLYINCDDTNGSHVKKVIETEDNVDIYDFLTKIYLLYLQSNIKNPEFDFLYYRLDELAERCQLNKNLLQYSKIYEIMKDDSSKDKWDYIKITKHKVLKMDPEFLK